MADPQPATTAAVVALPAELDMGNSEGAGNPASSCWGGRPGQGVDHLLIRVARGDEAAFAAVYDRVAGLVYALVQRTVKDRVRSQEVTENVLAEVWRSAPSFNSAAGTSLSWIIRIAMDQAGRHVRAARAASSSGHPGPGAATEDDDAGELRWLPELQQNELLLALLGGLSHGEIADLLGVPADGVMTGLRAGLSRLSGPGGTKATSP